MIVNVRLERALWKLLDFFCHAGSLLLNLDFLHSLLVLLDDSVNSTIFFIKVWLYVLEQFVATRSHRGLECCIFLQLLFLILSQFFQVCLSSIELFLAHFDKTALRKLHSKISYFWAKSIALTFMRLIEGVLRHPFIKLLLSLLKGLSLDDGLWFQKRLVSRCLLIP